ncbi:MAG: short-chain dehydrogenase [Verrucomicrobiales bacterium]|nr:short-chain dehydrogenase [Verrucomicrobiales bacterium]|tara:strand:+ start:17553 stop:18272 length:720 start_codon:yes stop_codon:yes gene_type:complete
MSKNAVVTGAGSGVGQASAIMLAQQGWKVAILGRRAETLEETVQQAGEHSSNVSPFVCDVGNREQVAATAKSITGKLGDIEVLVNSAGNNFKERYLPDISDENYHQTIDANMNGAFYLAQEFLPGMRERKSGTVVNVSSDSAYEPNLKAGVAYIMSKMGITGLSRSINCEEGPNNIRSCVIYPGEIDTPLLEKRPVIPDDARRKFMLTSEDVAATIVHVINLPQRAVLETIVMRPTIRG